MKILSLFDGISIAQQAFKELGFEVEYYASEIDKNAIEITQKNHPNTEQLGDIRDIDCSNGLLHYGKGRLAETDIYFLIGGSPCQDLSIAKKNREGLSGKRSGLFWEYVRILKDLKPKYFVLEIEKYLKQKAVRVGNKEEIKLEKKIFKDEFGTVHNNWIDWNIGSIMEPLYYSAACECDD